MSRLIAIRYLLLIMAGVLLAACQQEAVNVTTPVVDVPTVEITLMATTTRIAGGPIASQASHTPLATATNDPDTATPQSQAPTATETARPTSAPSGTPTQAPTFAPSATLTRQPTVQPTSEATTEVTSVPTETAVAPTIHNFQLVSEEEMNPGKRLTFAWSADGDSVMLVAGTRQRFIPWWQVPLSGTMTIELDRTLFRDPGVSLTVSGPDNDDGTPSEQVSETITIPWVCDYDYFFGTGPRRCPRDAATSPPAAQQEFEGGRMIWLQLQSNIIVLFDQAAAGGDGLQMRVYDDTWTVGEPESDPEIEPPADRLQPVRGFGKVWRENPEVRDGLGWALAPEMAFTATWQFEFNESIGTTSYLRLSNGQLARMVGYYTGFGGWTYIDS